MKKFRIRTTILLILCFAIAAEAGNKPKPSILTLPMDILVLLAGVFTGNEDIDELARKHPRNGGRGGAGGAPRGGAGGIEARSFAYRTGREDTDESDESDESDDAGEGAGGGGHEAGEAHVTPETIVGMRVAMGFPHPTDAETTIWRAGYIRHYDAASNRHIIVFDTGEQGSYEALADEINSNGYAKLLPPNEPIHPGLNILGNRMAIRWGGNEWYRGYVTEYRDDGVNAPQYTVVYDDGDVRQYPNLPDTLGLQYGRMFWMGHGRAQAVELRPEEREPLEVTALEYMKLLLASERNAAHRMATSGPGSARIEIAERFQNFIHQIFRAYHPSNAPTLEERMLAGLVTSLGLNAAFWQPAVLPVLQREVARLRRTADELAAETRRRRIRGLGRARLLELTATTLERRFEMAEQAESDSGDPPPAPSRRRAGGWVIPLDGRPLAGVPAQVSNDIARLMSALALGEVGMARGDGAAAEADLARADRHVPHARGRRPRIAAPALAERRSRSPSAVTDLESPDKRRRVVPTTTPPGPLFPPPRRDDSDDDDADGAGAFQGAGGGDAGDAGASGEMADG